MARPKTKTVYERIEEKLNVIKETEELLVKLNEELKDLVVIDEDELELEQ